MGLLKHVSYPCQCSRGVPLIVASASLLLVVVIFASFENLSYIPLVSNKLIENKSKTRKSKLGDGCYHVFLDVGANIGVHARFLYEPDSYPKADKAKSIFEKEFGTSRDNRDFCVFAFEPNPNHFARLVNLTKHFERLGLHYQHVPVAVSDSDGNITFFHNKDEGNEEWGFGDHKLAGDAVVEVVPKIRFVDWVMDEIYDRELPSKIYGNYSDINPMNAPKVVMKMDIESQEYAVVPDLMFSGALCKTINFAFGEFHLWWVTYEPGPDGHGGLVMKGGQDGKNFVEQLLRGFHSVKNCATKEFSQLDDESYLHDGIPL